MKRFLSDVLSSILNIIGIEYSRKSKVTHSKLLSLETCLNSARLYLQWKYVLTYTKNKANKKTLNRLNIEPTSQLKFTNPKYGSVTWKADVHNLYRKTALGQNAIQDRLSENTYYIVKVTQIVLAIVTCILGAVPETSMFISKNARKTNQFRRISLINVEGKFVFSVLCAKLATFVRSDGNVD